jgi:probable rRNA maturation factor
LELVELCVLLTDDKKLQKLNKHFSNKDCPTNVLSFSHIASGHIDHCEHQDKTQDKTQRNTDHSLSALSNKERGGDESNKVNMCKDFFTKQNSVYCGDIAISYQRVLEESIQQDKTFEAHLAHLVVHGVLHLLHYNHKKNKDAEVMEKKERDIMKHLLYKDPYKIEFRDKRDDM